MGVKKLSLIAGGSYLVIFSLTYLFSKTPTKHAGVLSIVSIP